MINIVSLLLATLVLYYSSNRLLCSGIVSSLLLKLS